MEEEEQEKQANMGKTKSLKEIQENTKANKEEMQKTLKEIQENFGQQAEFMKEETHTKKKSLKVKAIWQHLNPILLYQHVLDTPSHQ